jgi:hypothetical protein
MEHGFLFVANYVDVDPSSIPFEFTDGYVFRRALEHEIVDIDSILSKISLGHHQKWIPYNSKVIKKTDDQGRLAYSWEPIPPDKWKYWVISYDINDSDRRHNDIPQLIASAFLLQSQEIEFCIKGVYWGTQASLSHNGIALHHVEKYTTSGLILEYVNGVTILDAAYLQGVKKTYQSIEQLGDQYTFLHDAINNYEHLHTIPKHSPLSILGYFAILELLITHKPRSNETLDSVTHQVSNKMILLQETFLSDSKLSPSQYFSNGSDNKKLWKLLYSYRSNLAHGVSPDFSSDFKKLSNPEIVYSFIKEITRHVIIFGLENQRFLFYLREC